MIIADISVWVTHLRQSAGILSERLNSDSVLMHPFVIGGVSASTLRVLQELPQCPVASLDEVLALIAAARLTGSGIGYVDTQYWLFLCLRHQYGLGLRDRPLQVAGLGAGRPFRFVRHDGKLGPGVLAAAHCAPFAVAVVARGRGRSQPGRVAQMMGRFRAQRSLDPRLLEGHGRSLDGIGAHRGILAATTATPVTGATGMRLTGSKNGHLGPKPRTWIAPSVWPGTATRFTEFRPEE